jgi:hypothetical protein
MTSVWKHALAGLAMTAAVTVGVAGPAAADGEPRFFSGHGVANRPSTALLIAQQQAQKHAQDAGATGCELESDSIGVILPARLFEATVVIKCLW